jgi:hypothetical protein
MGQSHFATITALQQIAGCQAIMGSPSIAATLRMFSLWMWCHLVLLIDQSFIIALKGLPLGETAPQDRLKDYTG